MNSFSGTVIGEDVELDGDLVMRGSHDAVVRGVLNGTVVASCRLVVEQRGSVFGPIAAKNLTVMGRIETDLDINVNGVLDVKKGGHLTARRIAYCELEHESGARLSGQLEPQEYSEAAPELLVSSESELRDAETAAEESAIEGFLREAEERDRALRQGRPVSAHEEVNFARSSLGKSLASIFTPTDRTEAAPSPVAGVDELPFSQSPLSKLGDGVHAHAQSNDSFEESDASNELRDLERS